MKKYQVLAITLIFAAVAATPVFAARLVPGSVPSVRPLQPLPGDVAPNYSESINGGDDLHSQEKVTPTPGVTGGKGNSTQPGVSQTPSSTVSDFQQPLKNHPWLWALFIIILVLSAGYWVRVKYVQYKKRPRV